MSIGSASFVPRMSIAPWWMVDDAGGGEEVVLLRRVDQHQGLFSASSSSLAIGITMRFSELQPPI
jgi:hypothetical protein